MNTDELMLQLHEHKAGQRMNDEFSRAGNRLCTGSYNYSSKFSAHLTNYEEYPLFSLVELGWRNYTCMEPFTELFWTNHEGNQIYLRLYLTLGTGTVFTLDEYDEVDKEITDFTLEESWDDLHEELIELFNFLTPEIYIRKALAQLVIKIPTIKATYGLDESISTHLIEILPESIFEGDKTYLEWEEDTLFDFITKFPCEEFHCISASSEYLKVDNPIFEMRGEDYVQE